MADADDDDIPVYLLQSGEIGTWNRWRSSRLDHQNLAAAELAHAVLIEANLTDVDLTGANLTHAFMRRADLTKAKLTDAILADTDLRGAIFINADLTRANLRGADLAGTNLYSANLTGADLTHANLPGSKLLRANLRGANLTRAILRGADLRVATLSDANVARADLTEADLERANLRGADLNGADLYGADLRGADLYGANLRGADLANADLTDANFANADLTDADLTRVNLTNAILTTAIGVGESSVGDVESSTATLFVALTELRLVLPDGVDPTDVAEIVGAVAALARLVVTVGVDIAPPEPEIQGGTAVAVATQSPQAIEIATIRLHYGSDFIQWLGESWHWLEVTGGGGLTGLTVKDLLKRGDSKVLALLRTVFTRTGRDTLTSTLDAKNDEQLAAARAAVAKHNSDTVRDLAETVENAVRFYKAVEQFPSTTQEQAQANIAATHLTDDTQQALIDALGALSPLLRQGLTATTILTTQGNDNPQLD